MPDLTVHNATACEQTWDFSKDVLSSDGVTTYKVVYGFTPNGQYQHDWSCSCAGFKVRKSCKHIAAVQALSLAEGGKCCWDTQTHGGEAVDGKCPSCGGPTSSYPYAA